MFLKRIDLNILRVGDIYTILYALQGIEYWTYSILFEIRLNRTNPQNISCPIFYFKVLAYTLVLGVAYTFEPGLSAGGPIPVYRSVGDLVESQNNQLLHRWFWFCFFIFYLWRDSTSHWIYSTKTGAISWIFTSWRYF